MSEARLFEDVQVGDNLPPHVHGPLDIIETVRWAGVQENTVRIHYDREFARDRGGQRSFIASGSYRQALVGRLVTDWMGPFGRVRQLSIRNLAPTIEGDMMHFDIRVVEKSTDATDPWVAFELNGTNQDGDQIFAGRCTVVVPSRTNPTP